jgi:hypothetical protein
MGINLKGSETPLPTPDAAERGRRKKPHPARLTVKNDTFPIPAFYSGAIT